MLVATALLIIGLVLLVYGADRLVFSAAILCRSLGIPPLIIGMTVVGIGTSLPELIVSFSAATHGQMDIAVGTAMGSNITNILLILGGAALLHPLTVHSRLVRRELPLMLLVTLLCGVMLFDNELSRNDGLAMIAIAAIYLMFIIKIARRAERENSDSLTREQLAELPRDDVGNTVAFLWLAVALIVLPMSTRMVIDNATVIADYFGVSELVIGLTIISVGTSLPELATVIAGALKGEDDIAIGNLIGSNIYNMAIVLGIPALIHPGTLDSAAFARDYWVMLGVSALFTLICLQRSRRIGRLAGALLLCGFIVWVGMLYQFPSVTFW
ncbi:calcium/sodium antiporter [Erwinia aphidicola]|jgi:cation:H+ antiporter|uniref:Calcium/sodium antiporter n=1 Tax=Erwinia aphidicola TaxID=68334 RepID=A0ABU8DHW1_ERWAP|nr:MULTISPECIES: calcium/sodium antiporter [Erwinia]KMV72773.1 calcium/sodium:proton antiporter [bacteria symbiont BFo1 of Frankliniella occidentalis]PIJ58666.1 calcium/sodium antiporter [Erwinia sp. OLMDLW33]VTT28677.1 inner membrane protein YrbG [Klebsiella pneumoniae]KYP86598.1 calcium/sodium:proton antiporter [bacteria symbiont BFo1 of Frankliniella occidentalis]MBD1376039.1 calcium/sodium antiporter [Erwinia aphidicola]